MPRTNKASAPVGVDIPELEGRYVDLDGYTVVLASPYGTADGNWKPPEGGPFTGR